MLGLLAYGIFALIAAILFVGALSLVTRVGTLGDRSNGSRLILAWAFCFVAPYVWVETNTRLHAADLEHVVEEAVTKRKVEPDVITTKVQYAMRRRARLIVIARTPEEKWGSYRNIYALTANYDGEKWQLDEVIPINTVEGDSAGFTIPPYW